MHLKYHILKSSDILYLPAVLANDSVEAYRVDLD